MLSFRFGFVHVSTHTYIYIYSTVTVQYIYKHDFPSTSNMPPMNSVRSSTMRVVLSVLASSSSSTSRSRRSAAFQSSDASSWSCLLFNTWCTCRACASASDGSDDVEMWLSMMAPCLTRRKTWVCERQKFLSEGDSPRGEDIILLI